MKYVIFFGLLFHFCNLVPAAAAVRTLQIRSITEAKRVLELADEDTLVVFDLIDTLLRSFPTDYNPKLKPNLSQPFKQDTEQDVQLSLRMIEGTRELVEPIMKTVISKLQQRKIKVIGLSHYLVGNYGVISSIQLWRYLQLLRTGVDLSASFGKKAINLVHLAPYKGLFPQYYNGLLFTNGHSKGDALKGFLETINWKPKKIIAFDDNLQYLQSVGSYAEEAHINFAGYYYVAVNKKPLNVF